MALSYDVSSANRNVRQFFKEAAKQSKASVGFCISTKKVGSWAREDVTHLYKYREGTKEERKAFETAYSFGEGAKDWAGHLNVETEGDDLEIGMF